jgi:hypothetical protein
VRKLHKLEEQDLSPQLPEDSATGSSDQGLEHQGKHLQQASATDPTLLDDARSKAEDTSTTVSHESDKDREGLEYPQGLEGFHPERQLNGLRDVRLAAQQGRIAELRTQRDLEHAFEQTRKVVIDEQLRLAGMKARRRQHHSLLIFGLLLPVAALVAGLLYSGRLEDNMVLWAVAGTVFFMSYAAIVLFAATSLGAVAEMIQLIRTQFQSAEQASAAVTTTTTRSTSTLPFDELRDKYGQRE